MSSSFGMNLTNPRADLLSLCGCRRCANALFLRHYTWNQYTPYAEQLGVCRGFSAIFIGFISAFIATVDLLGVTCFHRKVFVLVTGSPPSGDPATPWPDPNRDSVLSYGRSGHTPDRGCPYQYPWLSTLGVFILVENVVAVGSSVG